MRPRIPLPTDTVDRWGLPDASGLAPEISAARGRLRRAAYQMRTVDPVMTELVRIQNARFQNCLF
jgi:hypothetical protein